METLFKDIILDEKAIDEENRTVTAIGSKEVIDRDGDLLIVKGIDTKNYKKNPVVLLAHDHRGLPVGKSEKVWVSKSPDGDELKFKVEFATAEESPMADYAFRLYKGGFLNTFSIGFIPDYESIEYPRAGENNKSKEKLPNRILNRVELLEISVVPVPANPDALLASCKKAFEAGALTDNECLEIIKAYKAEDTTEDDDLWKSYTSHADITPIHKDEETEEEVEEKDMNVDEKDWLYLLHHMHANQEDVTKIEILHHCDMFSKKGMEGDVFIQKHIKKGKKTFVHGIQIDDVKEVPEVLYDHLDNKFEIKTKSIDGKKYAVINNLVDKNIDSMETKLTDRIEELEEKITYLEMTKDVEIDEDSYLSKILEGFESDRNKEWVAVEEDNFGEYVNEMLED